MCSSLRICGFTYVQTHLKSQIEVFITTVFLRVLESENSTFEHKRQVLEVVKAFTDSPQALVEIFLNYDCDLHAIDLYNRIVNALSKVRVLVPRQFHLVLEILIHLQLVNGA